MATMTPSKIAPHLWFADKAVEAANSADGVTAPAVGMTLPTVAPRPACTSGITARGAQATQK